MNTRSTLRQLCQLCLLTAALLLALAPLSARAADGGAKEIEPASTSQIAPVQLPDGALRSNNTEDVAKFQDALQKIAETNHGRIGKVEVLVWSGTAAMKTLPARLKDAGYGYEARPAVDAEPGRVTPFGATSTDGGDDLLGMWIEHEGYALLIWGTYKADNAAKPGHPAAASATKETTSEKAEKTSGRPGAVPADLVGTWGWTTISSINHVDITTRQLTEPSGMAVRFTFTKDGRYRFFFFIHQRTYSLVTESTTRSEGTVTFNDDGTFTMHTTKGHYNGSTGSRIIDRDMTAEERQKNSTYYWEWRTENGKRQLYLGPSKSSMSLFKPADE